jgi:hypothetical protein
MSTASPQLAALLPTSSISYHADSCASATSASSPTGDVPRCCHSASNCSQVQRSSPRAPHPSPPISPVPLHTGTAPSAEEPCTSSNDSRRLNCSYALHRLSMDMPHEPRTPVSNPPHAPAGIPQLCPTETHRVHGTTATLYVATSPSPLFRLLCGRHPLACTAAAATPSIQVSLTR